LKNRNIVNSDEWYTPPEIYEQWNKEFNFDFDPCPANRPKDFDGLKMEWRNMNYVNPPYSRKLKEAFVKKGIEELKKGKSSVFLLPVSNSTVLFHDYIKPNATEIRFLRKRIKFIGINTKGEKVTNKCGQHDSMLVIFKAN
jgi:hypothetical protein